MDELVYIAFVAAVKDLFDRTDQDNDGDLDAGDFLDEVGVLLENLPD